jgi:cytochrome c oxidase cbb3-type subunit 3
LLFPGLGNYKGLLNWTSSNQGILNLAESKAAVEQAKTEGRIVEYDREIARAEQVYGSIFDAYAARPITELATDPEALKVGQRLYLQNCAQCHGSDARGQTGFPNLTDNDWLFGGSPEAIKHSLIYGRKAAMPGWLDVMGEQGVAEVAEYMLSLSGRQVDATLAKAGEARYAVCVACHGADGKGNQMIGAPNLTDSIWLYGGNKQAVIETLYYGRNGVMPAFKDTLGEQKVHLVSAYIYSLSQ